MTWGGWFGPSLAALLILLAALITYGRQRWTGFTAKQLVRLEAARMNPQPVRFYTRELDGLPPLVQRFFRTALSDGIPLVAAVSLE